MFLQSNEFKEALKELFNIERILETCFTNYNSLNHEQKSTTLIKSSGEQNNKFLITNDAIVILNTLNIENKILKNYIYKFINQHSRFYGDNCKIFYFYLCEFLRYLLKSNSISDGKYVKYRLLNLRELYESINKSFINQPRECFAIENFNCVEEVLEENRKILNTNARRTSLSVLNDLKIEQTFKVKLNLLIIEVVQNAKGDINGVIADLKNCLYFTKLCSNSNDVKAYKNGFLINRKFQLNNLNRQSYNAVFLDNELIFHLNENLTITNNSLESLANFSLFQSQDTFREAFIENIKKFNINIILTIKSLNDWQKSQLNRLNCSLVSYLDEEYVDYVCLKLGINKIANGEDFIEKNVISLDRIELILDQNHEILYYFRLTKPYSSLFFAHINVFLESFKEQIKSHYLKVLRIVRLLSSSTQRCKLIMCTKFEGLIWRKVDPSNAFYNDFYEIFTTLDRKFNNNVDVEICYEPFELKMRCFLGTLELLKQLFNLDEIVYVRSFKPINNKSHLNDEDED